MEEIKICFGWGQEYIHFLADDRQTGAVVTACHSDFQKVVQSLVAHQNLSLLTLAAVTPSLAAKFGNKEWIEDDLRSFADFNCWHKSDFVIDHGDLLINRLPHISLENSKDSCRARLGFLFIPNKGPVPISHADRIVDAQGLVSFGRPLPPDARALHSYITRHPYP